MQPLDSRRAARALGPALPALLLAGAAFAVALYAAPVAQAADEPSWAYELWHDVMSPYCPGRTLAECPSPEADRLRIWILTQAAAGAAREEVEANLYARFGDQIRTTPKPEGWGLAAYVIPPLAFVLFGGIVLLVLRRMVGRADTGSEPSSDPSVELAPALRVAPALGGAQLDSELERLVDEELGE